MQCLMPTVLLPGKAFDAAPLFENVSMQMSFVKGRIELSSQQARTAAAQQQGEIKLVF